MQESIAKDQSNIEEIRFYIKLTNSLTTFLFKLSVHNISKWSAQDLIKTAPYVKHALLNWKCN